MVSLCGTTDLSGPTGLADGHFWQRSGCYQLHPLGSGPLWVKGWRSGLTFGTSITVGIIQPGDPMIEQVLHTQLMCSNTQRAQRVEELIERPHRTKRATPHV